MVNILTKPLVQLLVLYFPIFSASGQSPAPFPSTPLKETGDLSSLMVEGIPRYLDRKTAESIKKRPGFWQTDYSDRTAYDKSVAPNRERFARIIGAVDPILADIDLEYVASTSV